MRLFTTFNEFQKGPAIANVKKSETCICVSAGVAQSRILTWCGQQQSLHHLLVILSMVHSQQSKKLDLNPCAVKYVSCYNKAKKKPEENRLLSTQAYLCVLRRGAWLSMRKDRLCTALSARFPCSRMGRWPQSLDFEEVGAFCWWYWDRAESWPGELEEKEGKRVGALCEQLLAAGRPVLGMSHTPCQQTARATEVRHWGKSGRKYSFGGLVRNQGRKGDLHGRWCQATSRWWPCSHCSKWRSPWT